ncbi:ankyrin repeat protein, partial [Cadophora sp. DSE1049]
SALERAVFMGEYECVKALVELGADVNEKDSEGYFPLAIAARHGQAKVAKYLIGQGADVYAEDGMGFSVLHITLKHKQAAVLQVL